MGYFTGSGFFSKNAIEHRAKYGTANSTSEEKGTDNKKNNSSEYNHKYYVKNKSKWKNKSSDKKDSSKDDSDDEEFDVDAAARDIIRGKYKNGAERKAALGDDYGLVQKRVNEILKGKGDSSTKKNSEEQDTSSDNKSDKSTRSFDEVKKDYYDKKNGKKSTTDADSESETAQSKKNKSSGSSSKSSKSTKAADTDTDGEATQTKKTKSSSGKSSSSSSKSSSKSSSSSSKSSSKSSSSSSKSSSKSSSQQKAEYKDYSEDDKDFEISDDEANRLGNTDFYGKQKEDGSWVIIEEDMKWTIPAGATKEEVIEKLEAFDEDISAKRESGEKYTHDDWKANADSTMNSLVKSGTSKKKSKNSSIQHADDIGSILIKDLF